MPLSCADYKVDYAKDAKDTKRPANAVDLHIEAVPPTNIDLCGVDGKGPKDPTAGYNVQGSGTGEVNISGITVAQGTGLTVRVCADRSEMPKLKAIWSSGRKGAKYTPIGEGIDLEFALGEVPAPLSEPVVDGGEPIAHTLEEIRVLAEGALRRREL